MFSIVTSFWIQLNIVKIFFILRCWGNPSKIISYTFSFNLVYKKNFFLQLNSSSIHSFIICLEFHEKILSVSVSRKYFYVHSIWVIKSSSLYFVLHATPTHYHFIKILLNFFSCWGIVWKNINQNFHPYTCK